MTAKPIAASAGVRQGRPATELVMNLDQKEALFKKFIEWQRSSENQRASFRNEGTEGGISQFM